MQAPPIAANQPAATPPASSTVAAPSKGVNRPPEAIEIGRPKYPEMASRLGISGTVIVKVTIDENGNVTKTSVVSSPNPVLNPAAQEAAMKSKFRPRLINDKPVSSEVNIPFTFRK